MKNKYVFPRKLPDIKVPPMDALEIVKDYSGMTLREYYAGQAMQALAASPFLEPEEGEKRGMTVAKNAVRYADALIAELEGGE